MEVLIRYGYNYLLMAACALILGGCAAPGGYRVASPTPMPPGYQVDARTSTSMEGWFRLQLRTRAWGCGDPRQIGTAIEQMDLYSPDGRVIRTASKLATAIGPATYAGAFEVEMPPGLPRGNYVVRIAMRLNGQTCGIHQGQVSVGARAI